MQQVMGSRRLRGGFFLALVLPSPRQELGYPPDWMIGQSREDVGEPGLRIDVVELGGLDQRVEKKTMLKLGIMCTIAPDQIIDLIGSIQWHHPGVELQLSTNAWDLQERLIGGALEVAIYCIPGEEPDPRLHVMPLFREQIVIAINPRHRLAQQDTIRVRDLDDECYIHRINCEFAGYADKAFQEQQVTCKPVYWSDRDDWTLAMIASGLGWDFMPQALRQPSWGRRHPDHRAGILAQDAFSDGAGSPAFACGRRAGARSDAGQMVRRPAIISCPHKIPVAAKAPPAASGRRQAANGQHECHTAGARSLAGDQL